MCPYEAELVHDIVDSDEERYDEEDDSNGTVVGIVAWWVGSLWGSICLLRFHRTTV